jgi:Aspartyl protease
MILKSQTLVILILLPCVLRVAAQDSTVATVPMVFQGPMPVVEVMINGKGPFHFTIDTGAQMKAVVDPAIINQLKIQPSGKVRGGDPSGRNARDFDTVLLDSLSLGKVDFRNVDVVSVEPRLGPNAPRVDGVLGFGLFSEYSLTLDYPGKQLRLSRSEVPAANGADILTFENPHVVPVIEISIGNSKTKAHIDSGNMVGGFILPTGLVENLRLASRPITVGMARTVTNEVEIREARLDDTIKFGSFEFKQPTITFPSIAGEVNIGLKVLRDFTITFDQTNKRVKFERQLPKTSSPSGYDIFGKTTNIQRARAEDKERMIGMVMVESDQKEAKVDKANLIVTSNTRIFEMRGEKRVQATFDDLKIGTTVAARFVEGPTIMIYPLRVAALEILIIHSEEPMMSLTQPFR